MGPKRYDYVGTKIFLKHRYFPNIFTNFNFQKKTLVEFPPNDLPCFSSKQSTVDWVVDLYVNARSYEAEVTYEEAESENSKASLHSRSKTWPFRNTSRSEKILCRANCSICNSKVGGNIVSTTPNSCPEKTRWCRTKGRFLSIGAAVMSNRNERAPDGLVVDAHLSDGFLHLILIKDCSRPKYLW